MYKAFLSHSSKQKEFVGPIFDALGKSNCIYDCMTFEAGKKTVDEIMSGLEESGLFVLFLSEAAVDSQWVQDEIKSARVLLTQNMKRVLPIIIDKNLTHTDTRIPSWLRESYNLKSIFNPQVVLNKIRNALYELSLDAHPIARRRHELFVGRNLLMDSFEKQMALRGLSKPSCLIIGGIEGVGRKTFLKYALRKRRIIKPAYEPISLFLDNKESIENVIIRLAGVSGHIDPIALEVTTKDLPTKIKYLQSQVASLLKDGELLMIIDAGTVVQPNRKIADWFVSFLEYPAFHNNLTVCVISRFKPYTSVELNIQSVLSFEVKALIEHEIRSLLIEYSELLGIELDEEDIAYFTPYLNGMPEQIQYTCNLIEGAGLPTAKKSFQKIIDRGKDNIEYVINFYKSDKQALNLLALLARLEFIGRDYLFRIIGDTDKNEELLASFYAIGVYDLVGLNKEYIRISYPIADYVRRSKFKITTSHWEKVKEELREFLSEPTNTANLDAAQLLLNIREALLSGASLPKQYYIPAFTLKTVVELYNRGKYREVISLAYTSLEYQPISDVDIVRELRYWLCMALAREGDDRFQDEIRHFTTGNDRHFLMGFNFRMQKKYPSAEYEYKQITGSSDTSTRAKRELVTVYIEQDKYKEALKLARDNYNSQPNNVYFIQSYFTSLIRKGEFTPDDIGIMNKLLESTKTSFSSKAASITAIMNAEYLYYVMNDYNRAKEILRETIESSGNRSFALKALLRIHRQNGNYTEADNIISALDKDSSREE